MHSLDLTYEANNGRAEKSQLFNTPASIHNLEKQNYAGKLSEVYITHISKNEHISTVNIDNYNNLL